MNQPTYDLLLVEDDEAHAELIQRAFESRPGIVRILNARGVREARRRLETAVPDLVITDLRLPDGDGAELIEPDRDKARYPVVVMTSFGDQNVAVEAMRTGALDYVVKSELTFAEMPHIAARALREWSHIVERRRAEAALRSREEHFRSLIENALDMIVTIERDGGVSYVSPAVRRVLGWNPDSFIGRNAVDLVHPDDRPSVRRMLGASARTLGSPQFGVVRLRSADGEWRSMEIVGQANASGGVVVNARDISERLRSEEAHRALEAQLRQSQKLETLGTLAGGIAHDFNNIMQAILGCTELARLKVGADSPADVYLERSMEVALRARDLVRQILQFSRQGDQKLAPVSVRAVVTEVARLLRATFPATIEIRENLVEDGVVIGDATQLHQVLVNIATNARQALGSSSGLLEVSVHRASGISAEDASAAGLAPGGNYVVVTLRDTGPGIPDEIKERIFEPFFTTKPVGAGTGLGLSVAHGIVKSHGGAIRVESAPGKGATFSIHLPETALSPAQGTVAATSRGTPRGIRVLLVDDDENVLHVTKGMLEGLGHQVLAVSSGHAAIDAFASMPEAFDLAIVDEVMPRMPGSQLAFELRQLQPRLPCVIASGHGPPTGALFEKAKLGYLAKPFEMSQLADAVSRALSASPAD
jgi:PAS domain S-box-containing protein